ncbi:MULTISPECIES: mechanosensitive ion channel family protein [unclassified Flavobacterium]|uniref:mechanosensitive ion channel family protein n=1 Tax=unclassified Flavobacterium TaxID=196869 RepID=UPI001F149667|nr:MULTISPECIES: mechanosensitive ion channel domain-containing protein [unclassified Flavobacterium]UMY66721.1 mechanosensitive ion channel [Flavobacterium sp. HJ-32-4]
MINDLIPGPDLLSRYTDRLLIFFEDYVPRVLSALIVLFIGLYVIRIVNRLVRRVMVKRDLDPTLSRFFADILLWALRILLFVTFISKLGVETSSFVAILGAAGLAVGLSLQGSLSNFAGGMLIIMFKPFRVGDTIEAQGVTGTVLEIQIFVTKLVTGNNQTIFVPNGALSNGTIINFSMGGTRRAELLFSIAYDADLKLVKDLIYSILEQNTRVLKDPAPAVVVTELLDNAVRLAIRPWAKNEDYGLMVSEVLERIKTALHDAGIDTQPFVKEASKQK